MRVNTVRLKRYVYIAIVSMIAGCIFLIPSLIDRIPDIDDLLYEDIIIEKAELAISHGSTGVWKEYCFYGLDGRKIRIDSIIIDADLFDIHGFEKDFRIGDAVSFSYEDRDGNYWAYSVEVNNNNYLSYENSVKAFKNDNAFGIGVAVFYYTFALISIVFGIYKSWTVVKTH